MLRVVKECHMASLENRRGAGGGRRGCFKHIEQKSEE